MFMDLPDNTYTVVVDTADSDFPSGLERTYDADGTLDDQTVGIHLARRAMESPLRQIVTNAGDEASVVLDKVKGGEGHFGYNAATGEYGDMLEMGVLDPAKVTRTALQNASSIAGLLLTTEALIVDKKDDDDDLGDMPDY